MVAQMEENTCSGRIGRVVNFENWEHTSITVCLIHLKQNM